MRNHPFKRLPLNKFMVGVVVVLSTVALSACNGLMKDKDLATVSGNVFYLQRIALPQNAKLTVTLSDVSLADAPSVVISQSSYITEGQQVPLPFILEYTPSDIQPNRTYNVSARIDIDGKMTFVSDTAYRVINDPNKTKNVKIKVVSALK